MFFFGILMHFVAVHVTHVTSSAYLSAWIFPLETPPAEVSNLDYDDYVGSGSPGWSFEWGDSTDLRMFFLAEMIRHTH